jgi:hypothetical protein
MACSATGRHACCRGPGDRLIACVALRTLHEIFTATPSEVVEAVVFNGHNATTGVLVTTSWFGRASNNTLQCSDSRRPGAVSQGMTVLLRADLATLDRARSGGAPR